MSSTRQLAAIMFTDIVGYSALMGQDSNKALLLVRISKDIQKPLVEKHNGRWLKEMGDGAMAQFGTALDAVNCSIEIQETARAKLDAKLRIGIHLGDITVENNDIYGDGVNVASRLESIADPGGIYVSDAFEKAIRGQSDIQAKYLGESQLKNVDYGVRTYALQGVGLPVPEIKVDQKLKGHFLAELQRRGILRVVATYVILSLLLLLVLPYAGSLIELPTWSATVLHSIILVGFPIALYLAWNYERSPEGFVKTTSQQSWQNPFSTSKRKPLTSNSIILGLILVIIFMYAYPQLSSPSENTGTGKEVTFDDTSIAVLPFVDLSPEGDQEYLGDGIAEEIINVLTRIEGLRVIGRTSSFSFKGQRTDLTTIGNKLGVGTILEGSVRKSNNIIRITAQLINAEDGSHLWSQTFERELEDIFAIQDEISGMIAEKFELTLTLSREESPPTRNINAYEMYLRGRQSFAKGLVGTKTGVDYLEKAIVLDPSFLQAYSILSEAHWAMGLYNLADPAESYIRARNAALKVIEIDPESYEGYNRLSWINFAVDWDWTAAYENYYKAVDRGLPHPDQYYAYYQAMLYSSSESITIITHLLENDPLSVDYLLDLSRMYLNARRFEDVIKNGKKVLEMNPENSSIKRHLGDAYLFSGNLPLALKFHGELLEKDSTYTPYSYIGTLVRMGREEEAWQVFHNLPKSVTSTKIAMCYIHLNELDSAFIYLDKAYDEKDTYMIFLKGEPHFDLIKEDPRYLALLKKMNFPED